MSDFKESQLAVLDDAITTFGITAQIHKAIEEMAELTVERLNERLNGKANRHKLGAEAEYDSAASCKGGDDNGGDCEALEKGVVPEADE